MFKTANFGTSTQLVQFVNGNEIKRDDITSLIFKDGSYFLFYWEFK